MCLGLRRHQYGWLPPCAAARPSLLRRAWASSGGLGSHAVGRPFLVCPDLRRLAGPHSAGLASHSWLALLWLAGLHEACWHSYSWLALVLLPGFLHLARLHAAQEVCWSSCGLQAKASNRLLPYIVCDEADRQFNAVPFPLACLLLAGSMR